MEGKNLHNDYTEEKMWFSNRKEGKTQESRKCIHFENFFVRRFVRFEIVPFARPKFLQIFN
jgi:hypothetical protein